MKILLLNPSVDFDKQFGSLKRFYTPIPSIGLAYIGAVLLKEGFRVVGLDSFMPCHTSRAMLDHILDEKPDVLGISLLTPASPVVDAILPELREKLPNCLVVLGNIHASVFANHYVEGGLADYVVHHEGEATMLELMKTVSAGRQVDEIKGITYQDKKTGRAVKTQKRDWIDKLELDKMPYPAWELFPVDMFKPDIRLLGKGQLNKKAQVQALPVVSSRGCPFNCTFCSPKNSIGNKYRMRTPKSVADEMEYFYKKWGTESFYYMDLTFPLTEKTGMEFCDHLIVRNLPVKWGCETRVSAVTLPLMHKMKEAKCYRIDFGIECGNQKMLDSVNKKFTVQQVRDAVAAAHKAGVESEGLFIIGLPGETAQDTWDTIHFALSLPLDHIKLNLFVPYPGSDIWDDLVQGGELRHMNFSEYTSYPSYTRGRLPFVSKGRSEEELIRLQKIGMRKAFFRKQVIFRELKHFKFSNLPEYGSALKALLFPRLLPRVKQKIEEDTQTPK